ncbi:ROK family transcriptional regulator [Kineosporia succinea]|uniref:NBD/HSP70 family sugar kinase n=1 Tax=Kineosporia succinea TaxID=84632 RepID=A0ABT9PC11_9ACTN|nr:ROK family transcriptional regulator [Kineosporia succinea]MDP9830244.1 putative NBD/HSP70 family sugar kinase [Kineosporia succinea]
MRRLPGYRDHNRGLVLAALQEVSGLTRAELVRTTGLSRTTVLGIVSELLDEGAVVAQDVLHDDAAQGPGRRPQMFSVTRTPGLGLAIDIGNQHLSVALADGSGRIVAHARDEIAISLSARETVARVAKLSRLVVRQGGIGLPECVGVTAGVPEPVNRAGDVARSQANARWSGTNPAQLIARALGEDIRVSVENDVNLGALGETRFGRYRGEKDVLYVKVSHGVGVGIMVDGRLVRGSDGLAGEIGHTRVREDGVVCPCGNRGCLYTLVTGQYLSSLLATVTGDPNLGTVGLARLGSARHPGAARVLRDAGSEVGAAVASLANALNPGLVLLGGVLARSGPWVLEGFASAIARYAEPQVSASLRIERGTLEGRAELFGAVAIATGMAPGRMAPASGA